MSKPEPAIRRIVLTGGPCGGKTSMTQVLAKAFESEIVVVPESASLLFSGGFPRWPDPECQRSLQRAIYHVQRELESHFEHHFAGMSRVFDRGTVDGAAYWPEGTEKYFESLGTSLHKELARYDCVIYLESADRKAYESHRKRNPNRTEDWEQAHRLDGLTFELWSQHPNLHFVKNERAFHEKVNSVVAIVKQELCRG